MIDHKWRNEEEAKRKYRNTRRRDAGGWRRKLGNSIKEGRGKVMRREN